MKVWRTAGCDEKAAADIVRASGLPKPIARVLAARGCTDSGAIDRYLNPRLSTLGDPFRLPGMAAAVDRIWKAVSGGEAIAVYGDYDVDGITSTALVVTVLRRLGARVSPFLPHRVDDGYGLSTDALARCLEESHPGLIVTVDCGTSAVEAVRFAREKGVDVVVTDHHEPGDEQAPAVSVVNPKLAPAADATPLAGVGVAFKLCHALLKHAREANHGPAVDLDLREYMDWVALGTICDMVPLRGENRVLARHGLEALNRPKSPGLAALRKVAGIKDEEETTSYHVGFLLGPRLNAAGRLGDAARALELLLTADPAIAAKLAAELDGANRERQQVEADTVEAAVAQIEAGFDPAKDYAVVAAGIGWHPGVVGIVASRLCAKYRRPAVVIALDESGQGRGSCRSIEHFNMVEGLSACRDTLVKWGGHSMAAGLEIEAGRVEGFKARFNEVAAAKLAGEDLRAVLGIDAWVDLGEVDDRLYAAQQAMRPFGLENPRPTWAVRRARIVGRPRILKEKHVRMTVTASGAQIEGIGFGLAGQDIPEGPIDVAFHLQLNTFRGRDDLEMVIQDFRPASDERSE